MAHTKITTAPSGATKVPPTSVVSRNTKRGTAQVIVDGVTRHLQVKWDNVYTGVTGQRYILE